MNRIRLSDRYDLIDRHPEREWTLDDLRAVVSLAYRIKRALEYDKRAAALIQDLRRWNVPPVGPSEVKGSGA